MRNENKTKEQNMELTKTSKTITYHEGWKIVGIKWDTEKNFKPSWMEEIIDGLYEDLDDMDYDLNRVAQWYGKPRSHFKVAYVTITITRDSNNNIISKECK
tara:strand:+ start:27 stop:329 length:303 start_codon:yes stop_codon:yes gene_type:complete